MKNVSGLRLGFLLCTAITLGGCTTIHEQSKMTDETYHSEIDMNQVQALVKSISKYIDTHVEGKKQSVFYDPETNKFFIQAELTNTEIKALYAKFDKNNIKIEPIDGEFIGITTNEKENPFAP